MYIDKNYWNNFYKTYKNPPLPNPIFVNEVNKLKPGSAIDLGSGSGSESYLLCEKNWDVTALDYSNNALQIIKKNCYKKNYNIQLLKADLLNFVPKFLYDFAYLGFVHTYPENLDILLSNCVSCLDNNGVFLYNGYTYDGIEHNEDSDFANLFPSLNKVLISLLQTDIKILYAEQKLRKSYLQFDDPESYYMSVVVKGKIE
jgi:SAM-dependent methyltransferase